VTPIVNVKVPGVVGVPESRRSPCSGSARPGWSAGDTPHVRSESAASQELRRVRGPGHTIRQITAAQDFHGGDHTDGERFEDRMIAASAGLQGKAERPRRRGRSREAAAAGIQRETGRNAPEERYQL